MGNFLRVYFGAGGHGCVENFILDLFQDTGVRKVVLLGTVDSGGATGAQIEIFRIFDCKLNQVLHGSKNFPILPFGDAKQYLINYLNFHYKTNLFYKLLDLRSNSKKDHFEVVSILNSKFKWSQVFIHDLKKYFQVYLDFYNSNIQNLPKNLQKKTCFGNLFLSFIFFYFGGHRNFSNSLKLLKIAPNDLDLEFYTKSRSILFAQDSNSNWVYQEGQIDQWKDWFYPKSFGVLDADYYFSISKNSSLNLSLEKLKIPITTKNTNYTPKIRSKVLEILKKANQVIIAPGSEANWLPWLNHSQIKPILQQKFKFQNSKILTTSKVLNNSKTSKTSNTSKNHSFSQFDSNIIWFTNPFLSSQEKSFKTTWLHFHNSKISLKTIIPNLNQIQKKFQNLKFKIKLKKYLFKKNKKVGVLESYNFINKKLFPKSVFASDFQQIKIFIPKEGQVFRYDLKDLFFILN